MIFGCLQRLEEKRGGGSRGSVWCHSDTIFLFLLFVFLFCVNSAGPLGVRNLLIIGYIAAFGLFGLVFYAWANCFIKIGREVILMWGFVAWGLLGGSLVSVDFSKYIFGLERTLQTVFLFAVVALYTSIRRSPAPAFGALFFLALIMVFYAAISGEFGRSGIFDRGNRYKGVAAEGLVENSNFLGLNCLWGLVSAVWFWNFSRGWLVRVFLTFSGFGMMLGIVFSASRKSFIIAVCFLLVILFIRYRKLLFDHYLKVFMVSVAGFLVVSIVQVYLAETYIWHKIFLSVEGGLENDQSAFTRWQLISEGFQVFWQNPLFGVGLSNFEIHSSLARYSHSNFIEVFCGVGMIGGLLYYGAYFSLFGRLLEFRNIRRISRPDYIGVRILFYGLIGHFIVGLVQVQYMSFANFAFFGAIAGASAGIHPLLCKPSRQAQKGANKQK